MSWPKCWAYGDFLLGICIPLAIARAEGAGLVLLREGPYRRDAAFDVRVDGVAVIARGRPLSVVLAAFLSLRAGLLALWVACRDWVSDVVAVVGASRAPRPGTGEQQKARGKRRTPGKLWRERRRESRRRLAELPRRRQLWHGRDQLVFGYDVRRVLADGWPGARLRREAEAWELARRFGLDEQTPIVAVHVREAGWHGVFTAYESQVKDAKRDAKISDFFPCFDWLRARGFTVARLGDSTMTPLERPGVVDLAHTPLPDNLLQLWAVEHSRFMIACDSGPFVLAWLFNVPMLMVNVVCHLECYPLRCFDRLLTKRVQRPEGGTYPVKDMWTYDFLANYKTLAPERYVDNTPEELCEAVEEMLTLTSAGRDRQPPSPAQVELRHLADALNRAPELMAKRTKRNDQAFIYTGDGYLSRVLAEERIS